MTEFPSTSTSLSFDPRSNAVEATASRRDNQFNTGSTEDRGFSRALDDSDARAEVRRDETQAPALERPTQERSTGERSTGERSFGERSFGEADSRNNNGEPAALENSAEQNGEPEVSANSEVGANNVAPESETVEGTGTFEGASENVTVDVSSFAFADIPEFANPFALAQQITTEAPQTSAPLLTPTAIEGVLPSGEIASSLITPQQNLAAIPLDTPDGLQLGQVGELGQQNQAGLLGQNLATQINSATPQANSAVPQANSAVPQANSAVPQANSATPQANSAVPQVNSAVPQVNSIVGGTIGDAFETVLSTQTGNASTQAGAQSLTNLQQNVSASTLQPGQTGDVTLQGTNANAGPNAGSSAGVNLTSTEGEVSGSFTNANQSSTTTTPSQQLASLLSGGGNADVALPNQAQVANGQVQQAIQQPVQQAVQQAAQPLAQFANAAFANDTLPAFTAQISRNFAAGQDSFNVRLNPSELGRVDVRVINNDDGTVSTQIRVERSETLDLFQRDIRALERTLQQSGVKLGSDGIDLSLKDNGTDQGGNSQAFDNDFDSQGEHAQNSDPAWEANEANQHLDNDGLLVDDLTGDIPLDQVQTIYARYQPGQLNIRV